MGIPSYDRFIEPLLRVLAEHPEGLRSSTVYTIVADRVGLTEEERAELLPSGRQRTYQNRVGWAHDRLKRRGLSSSPAKGTWRLTEKGRDFVAKHPAPLTDEEIEAIAEVPRGQVMVVDAPIASSAGASAPLPPEERIDVAVLELQEAVRRDLLEIIRRASPAFFESLILQLLLKMGYGASERDLERTGQSGDGGIDGIITLDRLGLDKVYLQAKRWKEGVVVGRSDIQAFVGALAGRRATRGVFITTSSFSSGAREYAKQVSDSLVLLDGEGLAMLMIEHEVGVSVARVVKIPRVDQDFFEDV